MNPRRGSALIAAWLVVAVVVAGPARAETDAAPAAQPPASAPESTDWGLFRYELPSDVLSLEVAGGVTFSATQDAPQLLSSSGSENGPFGAVSVLYRPDYFLSPFLDFAYYSLTDTTDRVSTAAGVVTAENSLSMWALSPGVVIDFWRLRARLAVSFENLMADAKVEGVKASSSRLSLGYLFGLGGTVYRWDDFALGLESRVALNPISDVVVVTIGATGSWDFVSF